MPRRACFVSLLDGPQDYRIALVAKGQRAFLFFWVLFHRSWWFLKRKTPGSFPAGRSKSLWIE